MFHQTVDLFISSITLLLNRGESAEIFPRLVFDPRPMLERGSGRQGENGNGAVRYEDDEPVICFCNKDYPAFSPLSPLHVVLESHRDPDVLGLVICVEAKNKPSIQKAWAKLKTGRTSTI